MAPLSAIAHSGGTDASGCHGGSRPYHCHRAGGGGEPSTLAFGTGCHPSYAGACVPRAIDVDCLGGSGDGPAFVAGPVRVVGADVYGLDRDNNGWGCER